MRLFYKGSLNRATFPSFHNCCLSFLWEAIWCTSCFWEMLKIERQIFNAWSERSKLFMWKQINLYKICRVLKWKLPCNAKNWHASDRDLTYLRASFILGLLVFYITTPRIWIAKHKLNDLPFLWKRSYTPVCTSITTCNHSYHNVSCVSKFMWPR